MPEPTVVVSPRGASRLTAGHPWVFQSDVRRADGCQPGDTVRVEDERRRFLGRAWFSSRSQITLRLVTRDDTPVDHSFLRARLQAAAELRRRVVENTEVYRLVYAESDGLPSLLVDRYANTLVLQTLSQAADGRKADFVRLLQELFQPTAIVERNDPKVRRLEGLEQMIGVLAGQYDAPVEALENGLRFRFDLLHGQKTGAFLDQRENRAAAARYARGDVLDCFCYAGGFACAVARNAASVEAVDLSPAAVAATREHAALNGLENVFAREANVFDLLKQCADSGRQFDTIILDPPAFAKNRASLAPARRGYKEINLRALKLLRPGGTLVTCSCSYHVSEDMLVEVVAEAAADVRRQLLVLERRTQARDHPVLLAMPESLYLKCLVLSAL
jgi:23S rRNA (cytosine1962-C5)-methyltransferase